MSASFHLSSSVQIRYLLQRITRRYFFSRSFSPAAQVFCMYSAVLMDIVVIICTVDLYISTVLDNLSVCERSKWKIQLHLRRKCVCVYKWYVSWTGCWSTIYYSFICLEGLGNHERTLLGAKGTQIWIQKRPVTQHECRSFDYEDRYLWRKGRRSIGSSFSI
jgi:hypothetical protein